MKVANDLESPRLMEPSDEMQTFFPILLPTYHSLVICSLQRSALNMESRFDY